MRWCAQVLPKRYSVVAFGNALFDRFHLSQMSQPAPMCVLVPSPKKRSSTAHVREFRAPRRETRLVSAANGDYPWARKAPGTADQRSDTRVSSPQARNSVSERSERRLSVGIGAGQTDYGRRRHNAVVEVGCVDGLTPCAG